MIPQDATSASTCSEPITANSIGGWMKMIDWVAVVHTAEKTRDLFQEFWCNKDLLKKKNNYFIRFQFMSWHHKHAFPRFLQCVCEPLFLKCEWSKSGSFGWKTLPTNLHFIRCRESMKESHSWQTHKWHNNEKRIVFSQHTAVIHVVCLPDSSLYHETRSQTEACSDAKPDCCLGRRRFFY